jgi:hypothetical protein
MRMLHIVGKTIDADDDAQANGTAPSDDDEDEGDEQDNTVGDDDDSAVELPSVYDVESKYDHEDENQIVDKDAPLNEFIEAEGLAAAYATTGKLPRISGDRENSLINLLLAHGSKLHLNEAKRRIHTLLI